MSESNMSSLGLSDMSRRAANSQTCCLKYFIIVYFEKLFHFKMNFRHLIMFMESQFLAFDVLRSRFSGCSSS